MLDMTPEEFMQAFWLWVESCFDNDVTVGDWIVYAILFIVGSVGFGICCSVRELFLYQKDALFQSQINRYTRQLEKDENPTPKGRREKLALRQASRQNSNSKANED